MNCNSAIIPVAAGSALACYTSNDVTWADNGQGNGAAGEATMQIQSAKK